MTSRPIVDLQARAKDNPDKDARAYNEYVSAAVELSDGHVGVDGLFTVIRSVRDLDNSKRRRYLYSSLLIEPSVATDDDPNKVSFGASSSPSSSSTKCRLLETPPVELSESIQWRIPSPSGRKVAILRLDDTSSDADSKKKPQILEIWQDSGRSLHCRILLSTKLHGKVIADTSGTFGRPAWNQQETCLVYAAERKAPTTTSFFAERSTTAADSTDDPSKKSLYRGGQNVLGIGKSERWGEQFPEQEPVLDLFCVNVTSGNVGRVENVPTNEECEQCGLPAAGGYSLGQAIFTPDGSSVVYTALDAGGGGNMPRRLGLIHCQQRPCKLYRSSVHHLLKRLSVIDDGDDCSSTDGVDATNKDHDKDEGFHVLTPNLPLARSPQFSPDGKVLVFLGSAKAFDTHAGCLSLFALHKTNDVWNGECRIVVDQVWDPRTSSPAEQQQVAGLNFPGLFLQQIPEAAFISSDRLLLTTQWGSCQKVIRVSVATGNAGEPVVDLLQPPTTTKATTHDDQAASQKLVCVTPSGSAIISTETPFCPASLCFVPSSVLSAKNLEATFSSPTGIQPLLTMQPIAATTFSRISGNCLQLCTFQIDIREPPVLEAVDLDLPLQSILLLPPQTLNKGSSLPPPMIVVPHGGPHSVSSTNYIPSYAYLCGHGGYAILLINYRGSAGFGQASIESLPGNIGTADVSDVIHVTRQVQNSGLVDPTRIGICGGSHGGFLTGHCTGQFPELFQAAAMRNPVVNIPSMTSVTDIPDWCFVEACSRRAEPRGKYNWAEYRPPTREELIMMRDKSPIVHVAQVRTPTLVALGLSDLRVPPSQGLEWYHTLRSNGVPTKLLIYEKDNHAIAGVQSEADHWISIKQWFDQYLMT